MKPSALPAMSIVFVLVLTTGFTTEDLSFTVKIQGIENRDVLKEV
ncbi:MAG: hypothetical protein WD824_20050 [Cyclobacteriaceae bacterium]